MAKILPRDCCVLNGGNGSWAFEPLAVQLSHFLGVDVSSEPRGFNYLLHVDDIRSLAGRNSFISIDSIRLASDKRLLATAFLDHHVPTPQTKLFHTYPEVVQHLRSHADSEWCLKYPTSCGASGHRLIAVDAAEPPNWPRPFIVQEFIRLDRPEVYRTYCAGGRLFGWVVRRFPEGSRPSPWVAHARGARYVRLGDAPSEALDAATKALVATGLWTSFGCVDLIRKPTGEWLVLEVGTDGLFNHVDREIGDLGFERELNQHIAEAFWCIAENQNGAFKTLS